MYFIKQMHEVECSHRLMDHPRGCKNIHGHTYKFTVCLKSKTLNEQGMVIDFGDMKKLVYDQVIENYDHCLVLEHRDPLYNALYKSHADLKLMPYDGPPTAERMAQLTADYIALLLTPESEISVAWVEVQETTGNSVRYEL